MIDMVENTIMNDKTVSKSSKDICEWIIPCNILYYDVIGAFNELKKIEWKQSVNIKENDIVYIYLGKPFSQIKYKCIARKVDLERAGRIDDSKFILDGSNYINYGRYMELELLCEYEDQQYPYCNLKNKGLKSVQGPSRVNDELSNYIKLIQIKMDKLCKEQNNEENEISPEDIEQVQNNNDNEDFEDNKRRIAKKPSKIVDGVKVYLRNKKVAINALARAKYMCEIDNNHATFKRRNSYFNYTEPHHLIPLKYSELFDYSLDVEENIISLCSNCHNNLHYGDDYKELLKTLYNQRIESLNKVGLYIDFEDLLDMY